MDTPAKSPKNTEDSPHKGRRAILDAVVRVVGMKGLRGLTFRAIAQEADVSPSLIAHHFGTRDNTIAEALAWVSNYAITSTHLEAFSEDPAEFESALVASVLNEPELHAFQVELMLEARRQPALQEHIREIYQTYLDALNRGRPGAAPKASSATYRTVFAGIDGLILQLYGGAITIAEFRESLEILRALASADPHSTHQPASVGY